VRRALNFAAIVLVVVLLAAPAPGQAGGGISGPWVMEQSGTAAGLRGIHAVSADIAWASGTNGTILRTVDGGATWQRCATPPGAERLDFRGVWAWGVKTAIAMSSGPGDQSRLYRTEDGCKSWKLSDSNEDKDGFWDCIAMWAPTDGFLAGDPVEGSLFLSESTSFDDSFRDNELTGVVRAMPGEGLFAASNSCLALGRFHTRDGTSRDAWFVTGGPGGARLVHSRHFNGGDPETGETTTADLPMFPKGNSAGAFSISLARDGKHMVVVGGDYARPNDPRGTAAWSTDGGKTWTAAAKPPHGYRSAVAWDSAAKAWVAAGTNGSDISCDNGKTWVPLDNGNWNALSLPWAVGPDGRIARLDPKTLKC
jgi:photosystem II stability/assembly factor-like uncharacterized protein